jgi:hypothetical protein
MPAFDKVLMSRASRARVNALSLPPPSSGTEARATGRRGDGPALNVDACRTRDRCSSRPFSFSCSLFLLFFSSLSLSLSPPLEARVHGAFVAAGRRGLAGPSICGSSYALLCLVNILPPREGDTHPLAGL